MLFSGLLLRPGCLLCTIERCGEAPSHFEFFLANLIPISAFNIVLLRLPTLNSQPPGSLLCSPGKCGCWLTSRGTSYLVSPWCRDVLSCATSKSSFDNLILASCLNIEQSSLLSLLVCFLNDFFFKSHPLNASKQCPMSS